ncbi:MAG: hypothetical protein ACK4E7_16310 [Permianibacter sp.]
MIATTLITEYKLVAFVSGEAVAARRFSRWLYGESMNLDVGFGFEPNR